MSDDVSTDSQAPEEVMSTDEVMTIRQRIARIREDLEALEAALPQEEEPMTEPSEEEDNSESDEVQAPEPMTYGGRGGGRTMGRKPAAGRGRRRR